MPELLSGAGFGLSFLPMTMSATAGIAPQEAGLASGLANMTRQLGGAIGLAAAAAIAAVHAHTLTHHALAVALTSGYDRAFSISAGVLVVGGLVALLLPAQLGMAQVSAPTSLPRSSSPSDATECPNAVSIPRAPEVAMAMVGE